MSARMTVRSDRWRDRGIERREEEEERVREKEREKHITDRLGFTLI